MPQLQCVILGIDPGMHTGLALTRLWKMTDDKNVGNVTLLTHDKIRGFALEKCALTTVHGVGALSDAVVEWTNSALDINRDPTTGKQVPVFLAVEHFVLTVKSLYGGGKYAVEAVGVAKAARHLFFPKGVWLDNTQKTADKNNVTDEMLRQLGLMAKGDGQQDHAHDAARHAVVMASRIRTSGMRAIRASSNIDDYTTRG